MSEANTIPSTVFWGRSPTKRSCEFCAIFVDFASLYKKPNSGARAGGAGSNGPAPARTRILRFFLIGAGVQTTFLGRLGRGFGARTSKNPIHGVFVFEESLTHAKHQLCATKTTQKRTTRRKTTARGRASRVPTRVFAVRIAVRT